MQTNLSILLICLLVSFGAFAQHNISELPTSISDTGTQPDNSAILDLQSSNKGLLAPRMTYAEIKAIPSPAEGLLAYDTENHCLRIFNGSEWDCLYQKFSGSAEAQNIFMDGGSGTQFGYDIAADASGNVYVVGTYNNTTIFGNTTLNNFGNYDAFIAKYDSSGTLIWVKNLGGTSDDRGFSIAVSQSGDIYLTGYFTGAASCDGTDVTGKGYRDIFIAKYNTSGTLQWVETAGASSDDMGYALDIDSNGNVYITGHFTGTATFGSNTVVSNGSKDVFIAKYTNAGVLLWVTNAGGTGTDSGDGLVVDDIGNIYLTGRFEETASFGTFNITSAGKEDIFLAKYDTNGNPQWVKQVGGIGYDVGSEVALDDTGNVYLAGACSSEASFDGTLLNNLGGADAFLAKYDNQGNFIWTKHLVGGGNNDATIGAATDANGNIYVTGHFQGIAIFDNGITLKGLGSLDVFIAKYDSTGNLQWMEIIENFGYSSSGRGVTVSPGGDVYVTGYSAGIALFGETPVTGGGGNDMFIAKYSQ